MPKELSKNAQLLKEINDDFVCEKSGEVLIKYAVCLYEERTAIKVFLPIIKALVKCKITSENYWTKNLFVSANKLRDLGVPVVEKKRTRSGIWIKFELNNEYTYPPRSSRPCIVRPKAAGKRPEFKKFNANSRWSDTGLETQEVWWTILQTP